MEIGIYTNQFHAEYDYEAIDRDFDIYVITKPQNLLKTNILDTPSIKYKAVAVQYMYGINVLVLFRKETVDEYDYRMEIQNEYEDSAVKRLNIFDETERQTYFYYNDRLLAQLLLNSLSNSSSEERTYHNLTGKLFYSRPDWIKRSKNSIYSLYMLEAAFAPGMYLSLSVKSFRPSDNGKKKEYVFDKKSGAFRRKNKTDKQCDSFTEGGSYNGKHNTAPFLNIKNIDAYRSCKLGVLKKLLDDAEKKLGKYMTLASVPIPKAKKFEVSEEQKKAMDPEHLSGLIDSPIYIADEIGTEESLELAEKIKSELEKYYGLNVVMGTLHKNAFNIRIIHDKEYYSENDLPDLHESIPKNIIVQHVTIESAQEAELLYGKDKNRVHPMINKLLQELVIKRDIQSERITVFDWQSIGYDRDVTFVMRKKTDDDNETSHINSAGKKVYHWYEYTTVTISPNGVMKFNKFTDNDKKILELHEKIIRAYEIADYNSGKIKEDVEGLVYYESDNIHSIIRTPMSTMPNIHAIWNGLEETDPHFRIEKAVLIDALDEFEVAHAEYAEYACNLKKSLEICEDSIEKRKINKIMDYKRHPNAFKKVNRFLHNNYGIRINSEIKSKDYEDEYLLDNILDIKYYIHTDEKGINEFRYFVGTKRNALQTSVHNACAVRKVVSENGNIEFETLLPLMAVDFVRNNQYTVLPFPFKFLREY